MSAGTFLDRGQMVVVGVLSQEKDGRYGQQGLLEEREEGDGTCVAQSEMTRACRMRR